jgi:predicted esterase
MYPLDQYPPEYKEHVQLQGLRESAEYVHVLLEEAVAEVGAENVVLMGLSQGCAVGLVSLLLWKGVKLGGFVGMCGWLPLRKSMGDVLETVGEVGDADDVFEVEGDKEEKTKLEQVVDWLRAEIDFTTLDETMSAEMFASRETSIFLGHGTEDRKVPCELRMLAVEFLRNVDMEVTYQEYTELGHWYSGDMLRDIVVCLNGLKG